MINIRFKIGSVIFALVAAYFLVNYASAATISPDPFATSDINAVFQYCTGPDEYAVQFRASGVAQQQLFPNNCQNGTLLSQSGGEPIGSLKIVFLNSDLARDYCVNNTYNNCVSIQSSSIILQKDITYIAPPPSNTTWGSDNGFWGDNVTADDVKSDLTASVQETGASIWPLLAFLGVSLAFIFFLQVMLLPKRDIKPVAVQNKKTKTFDPVAFDKKADELERFYSKTGGADPALVEQIKKRGRGRPKKIKDDQITQS